MGTQILKSRNLDRLMSAAGQGMYFLMMERAQGYQLGRRLVTEMNVSQMVDLKITGGATTPTPKPITLENREPIGPPPGRLYIGLILPGMVRRPAPTTQTNEQRETEHDSSDSKPPRAVTKQKIHVRPPQPDRKRLKVSTNTQSEDPPRMCALVANQTTARKACIATQAERSIPTRPSATSSGTN
jgi:hypothetical protein